MSMLMLPRVNCARPFREYLGFVLDGKYYFLSEEDLDDHITEIIHVMDPITFTTTALVQEGYTFDEYMFYYTSPEIVVHESKAYFYSMYEKCFMAGSIDGDVFRWTKIDGGANSDIDCMSAFRYEDETGTYYCSIESDGREQDTDSESGSDADSDERPVLLHRVNLRTFISTKEPISFTSQSIFKLFSARNEYLVHRFRVFSLGHFLHFFGADKRDEKKKYCHCILDLSTMVCRKDDDYEDLLHRYGEKSATFPYDGAIWLLSEKLETEQITVCRCNQAGGVWKEVGTITDVDCKSVRSRRKPVTIGSRVLFMVSRWSNSQKQANSHRAMHCVYVIEMAPSLFDRAAVAIATNTAASQLAMCNLPDSIRECLTKRRILSYDSKDCEPREIQFLPATKITFSGPYDISQTARLKLCNFSDQIVVWTLKTNVWHGGRLDISPEDGVLTPGHTSLVKVALFNDADGRYPIHKLRAENQLTIEWTNGNELADDMYTRKWKDALSELKSRVFGDEGCGPLRRKTIAIEYNE